MATEAARNAAEVFLTWVQEEERSWSQGSITEPRLPNQPRFSSYGEAHRSWLFYANGLQVIHHRYDLAVEAMLVIFVQLDKGRPVDMPLAYPEPDSQSWDHMTENGFRRLGEVWQRSPLRNASC